MLSDAGYQALFVGGCVRNALLGAPVNDLDLATDARPSRVLELSKSAGLKAIPTGIDHGTVTVMSGGQPYEVTTFRNDVETDGRRAVVAYSDSMEEDARRRDFTVNALYATSDGGVLDPVGGLSDLEARRIRFIDDPTHRIREDYLRILRFFRFHAWYGDADGGIDPEGLAACGDNIDGIKGLSKERIGQEMIKLLAAPDPSQSLASMAACGALMCVLPGADPGGVALLTHMEERLDLPADSILRLASIGGANVQASLRLSRSDEKQRVRLIEAASGSEPARALGFRLGSAEAVQALALRAALLQRPPDLKDRAEAALGAMQVFPISAADLRDSFAGPELGKRLRSLETAWISSGFRLSREELLDLP